MLQSNCAYCEHDFHYKRFPMLYTNARDVEE